MPKVRKKKKKKIIKSSKAKTTNNSKNNYTAKDIEVLEGLELSLIHI